MILNSKNKLKNAYRRIIFGMCLYDIFSSLPIALRPFKVIPDDATIDALLAFGNQTSCNILSFIQIIGVVGTPMYSVSLNIYYLYLIKYNMRERTFRRKIEPYVHGIPAVWTLSGAIFALASQMYNPGSSGGCFVASKPVGCKKNDDIECENGEHASQFFLIFAAVPISICFVVIVCTLLNIYWTIRKQEILMNKYRIRRVSFHLSTKVNESVNSSICDNSILQRIKQKPKRKKSKGRHFLRLASLYVLGFIITYLFSYIVQFMSIAGKTPAYWILLVDRLLQPCQGICNIFIYTSPQVKDTRKNNPGMNLLSALIKVVRNVGGDDDDTRVSKRKTGTSAQKSSRSSLRSSAAKSIQRQGRLCKRGGLIDTPSGNNELYNTTKRNSIVHFEKNSTNNRRSLSNTYARSSISDRRSSNAIEDSLDTPSKYEFLTPDAPPPCGILQNNKDVDKKDDVIPHDQMCTEDFP